MLLCLKNETNSSRIPDNIRDIIDQKLSTSKATKSEIKWRIKNRRDVKIWYCQVEKQEVERPRKKADVATRVDKENAAVVLTKDDYTESHKHERRQ